jgi:RNA polymerase sigma-70 factor (ECF subfamily)
MRRRPWRRSDLIMERLELLACTSAGLYVALMACNGFGASDTNGQMPTIPRQAHTRSDADLIRRSRRDPAAFEALMERHAKALDCWLLAKTGDAQAAHELMAETFAQAWLSARRFRGDGDDAGAAWLYGIARNLAHQHHRRGRLERGARQRLGMQMPATPPEPQQEVGWHIDVERLVPAVRAAFAELSVEQQRAIACRVIGELSYEELATKLDCTPTTARSRVFRGLRTLKANIARGAQP